MSKTAARAWVRHSFHEACLGYTLPCRLISMKKWIILGVRSLFCLALSSRLRSSPSHTDWIRSKPYRNSMRVGAAFEDFLLDRGGALVTRENMAVGRLQSCNPLLPS